MPCFYGYWSSSTLISVHLLATMGQEQTPTRTTITTGNGLTTGCKGFIKKALVTFLGEVHKMGFPVVDGASVNVLIWLTDIERLQAALRVGGQFVDFNGDKRLVRTGLKPETEYLSAKNEPKEDEDLTTEFSSMDELLQF